MVERRRGEKTSFVMARETAATGSPVKDRTQAVKRRYVVTAWNHDENSEKQQSDALRGGRADVFGEDGFLWGDGDIEIEIPSEQGFLDIIQGVLADPNPVSVAIPDKTLVAAGTNLSAIVAANYFTDPTAQTVDAVNAQNLADTALDVVAAGASLSSGTPSVANNLSTYPEALTLTVTLADSPTLSAGNTPGTVVITYTDANGATQTLTASFATGALTTPQELQFPAGSTITGVAASGFNAGTFSITAAIQTKTINDNLSGYASALTLTLRPTSATLVGSNTEGTVIITYRDSANRTQTLTLKLASGALTATPEVTLPADATILRVHATDFSAGTFDLDTSIPQHVVRNPNSEYTGLLKFDFSAAIPVGVNAPNVGKKGQVIVSGVRKVGLASGDTLPLKETIPLDDAGTSAIGTKYFYQIHKVVVQNGDGAAVTTGTVTVTSRPGQYDGATYKNLYKTALKTVNVEFPGWSLEPEIGGEPWLVTKAVPIGAEIEVGENIRCTIDILSNRVDKRRTIEGGDEERFIPTAVQYPTEFPFVGRRFFSGYGRYLEIDGEAVICDAAPIVVTHNYDFAQGKKPSRFRRDTEPNARRNVTCAVQTKYESGTSEEDIFLRWDEKFRDNVPVNAKVVLYQWQGNGRQFSIMYEMKYCEIQSPVRVAATGPGTIPIQVDLKAVPSPGETDGELIVTIISDDQWIAA